MDIRQKIENHLRFIYKGEYLQSTTEKLAKLIEKYKMPPLEAKDKWTEKDIALITYGDSILNKGEMPLVALNSFLNKYLKDTVNKVHILPFFPYSSDDGFSVIDFKEVNPELGDWEDIGDIGENFDLMADLVINHASVKSEWFKKFLEEESPEKDFFIDMDPSLDLSDVVRPRNTPLLTEFKGKSGTKHVWTTFSADQADLNFKSQELMLRMMDALLFYISKGAKIIRLDAIAFLWKEPGTSCLHLPETHQFVKLMRDISEAVNPETIILTETNVPNKENLSYFGSDDEAHMVYQFSLPPLLLHALHTANPEYLNHWANSLPEIPENNTFFNFTASHDGIGVRPLEGLLPEEEKKTLFENMKKQGGLINYKTNKDGSSSPYELNITYFDAMKGTAIGQDEFQVERFLASQTIMLEFKGMPAFYIHSFTATQNYHEGVKETGHNRAINRRKWNLQELEERFEKDDDVKTVFSSLSNLIKIRRQLPAFHPSASQRILELNEKCFSLLREYHHEDRVLCITNLSTSEVQVHTGDTFADLIFDHISGHRFGDEITLQPYQTVWLSNLKYQIEDHGIGETLPE